MGSENEPRPEPAGRVGGEGSPEPRTFTVLLLPHGGREARSLRISYPHLRRLLFVGGGLVLLGAVLLGSWWYFVARAHRTAALEAEIATLAEDRGRVEELARSLLEVEAAYERLRSLFGPDHPGDESWLPPPTGRPPPRPSPDEAGGIPTSWPLTERGFLTQPLVEGAGTEDEHPGIDIAVAAGSYIRASGPGVVAESGEDPVYGLYLVLDHGEGYRTLYAHASVLLVERGDQVRRNEVVGLTGSSGRSTAPHLHFEILRDGEPVDPLSLVRRP
jgi:murein DD-endopeptidase MepM/ murein hydrolase activator NlpD